MTVEEYAKDVKTSIDHILNLCDKLNISATNKNDFLSEDDIILLDSEINTDIEEEVIEEQELEDEVLEKLKITDEIDKMKPKSVSIKPKDDTLKYQKEKKQMYKNKEKLQVNKKDDDKIVLYKDMMTVKELAELLNVSPNEIIKKLFNLGVIVNINQSLDYETAELIVIDYNKELKKAESRDIVNFEEYEINDSMEDLKERPPVVTIMGHVDHGKTSLLDVIRKSNIVKKES